MNTRPDEGHGTNDPTSDSYLTNKELNYADSPPFATQSDGALLMSVEHAQGRDLSGYELWTGFVLNRERVQQSHRPRGAWPLRDRLEAR